jgi:hypothetical protein
MKFKTVVFARHLPLGGNPVFVKPYRALNATALCLNVKRATYGRFLETAVRVLFVAAIKCLADRVDAQ